MMAALPIAQRMRRLIAGLYEIRRRIAIPVISCFVVTLALAAASAGLLWETNVAQNRTITALIGGYDVTVSSDAAPELLFARAYFLLEHARFDDAQQIASSLEHRGSDQLRADLHYDMGNARLKLAFDKIEGGDFDAAGALVGLAREDYREAIRLNPDGWNARFNFDVASRLVREYPSFGFTEDERRRGPRPLWTELPNIPRGEP
jgi:mxaK protein